MRAGSVLMLGLLAAATSCAPEQESKRTPAPAGDVSGLTLSLQVDGTTDVARVGLRVVKVACEVGQMVEPVVLETEAEPSGVEVKRPGAARAAEARVADEIAEGHAPEAARAPAIRQFNHVVVAQPGCYDVEAVPQSAAGRPSQDCAPAAASAVRVINGEITPVFLVSQCHGTEAGLVDVALEFNRPPTIVDIQYDPDRRVFAARSITICVQSIDPDGDAVEIEWGFVEGPVALIADSQWSSEDGARGCAAFTPPLPGDYRVAVTAYDLIETDGASMRVEDWLSGRGQMRDSHHGLEVPLAVALDPQEFVLPDAYPGVKVRNDMISFRDYQTFQDTIETLKEFDRALQRTPGTAYDDLVLEDFENRLRFHSLRAEIERASAVAGDDEPDPDDHFIPDDFFRAVLNPQAELQIGDAIYLVRPDFTLEIPDGNVEVLARLRDNEREIPDGVERHGHAQSRAQDDCRSNRSCKKTHVYETKRRFKAKIWVFNSWVYASVGAKTEAEKRGTFGWSGNKVDKIEVVMAFDLRDSRCEQSTGASWDVVAYNKKKAKWSWTWWGQTVKVASGVSFHSVTDRNITVSRWLDLFDCDNSPVSTTGSNAPPPAPPPIPQGAKFHRVDVDGDTLSDLVFVGQNWSGPGLNIRTKRSNGDGTWTHLSAVLPDGSGVHTYPALTGDVDGDGRTDLIFVGQGWTGAGLNVRVKRSNGDGTWTPWTEILGDGPGVHVNPAHVMNVDNNNAADLVFVGQGWNGAGLNIRSKMSNSDGTWAGTFEVQGDGAGVHTHPALAGPVR